MSHLTRSILDCPCGKPHICPIRAVEIGDNALSALPALSADYHHILVVADGHTHNALTAATGTTVEALLGAAVAATHLFPATSEPLIPNESALSAIEARLTPDTDLIIGIGSGVINDLCKQVSFIHGLPYIIVATAPSMDGYASVGAALILGGMKVTQNARPPMAIVADTRVLRAAPLPMIRAGYGDIIGKYSCLNDWRLAAYVRGEYFCEAVYTQVLHTADRVRALAPAIRNRDPAAIAALMEALVEVGIAMAYVGNSRPASGSEHHLAHFFEITGILSSTPYLPHGIDVACGSALTARLRAHILHSAPHTPHHDPAAYEHDIRTAYTSIADSVLALQARMGWYDEPAVDEFVLAHMDGIRAILAEAPTEAETVAMIEAVGLSMTDFLATYPAAHIETALRYAKDLKDRYTVLWLCAKYFAWPKNT